MNISAIFIKRPIATTLLTIGIVIAGIIAFFSLPVAPLPQVDFAVINVQANLPGASPEVMAATVATPLERSFGRIAGINEMTSISTLGSTNITLQFDLNRDINGAAREVQAAINAARALLPSGLPKNPIYRKVNPADAPIMAMSLTSDTLSRGELYDAASTILAQRISQIEGVGQVITGGAALPAVRISLNPDALSAYGVGLEDVRKSIVAANQNRPKGSLESEDKHWQIGANDQISKAKDYLPLIISQKNGISLRLSDVATANDSMQDIRNAGNANGKPAIILLVFKQPNANIIETVNQINALMPELKTSISQSIDIKTVMERTTTIKAALHDVEITLLISLILVVLVVFAFLRDWNSTFIPAVAILVSIIGTFAAMYLLGYSLNNLSLMAITIATGFVVDDAIVVLENITRHLEKGIKPMRAAMIGAKEVGFTVISMSISLIAVFIPLLFMGGIIGRIFNEFINTLSIAILISLLVSLTLTPMMCSIFQKNTPKNNANGKLLDLYAKTLSLALKHKFAVLISLIVTIIFNVYLYTIMPYGLLPKQDTGRLMGSLQADQNISFKALNEKLDRFVEVIRLDPAIENVVGIIGGGQQVNSGRLFVSLKPLAERKISAEEVIARLRKSLEKEPGAKLVMQSSQDINAGGRQSAAQYQYTLQADNLKDLREWSQKIFKAMGEMPELVDVTSDAQEKGSQINITYDRDAIYRFGLTPALINANLNDAFGQRQISVIYNPLNQYRVVMEVGEQYSQSEQALDKMFIISPSGDKIPFASFAKYQTKKTPLAVNHQGQFAATTLSFNLPLGVSLGQASAAIEKMFAKIGVPDSVHGSFQGTAKMFKDSFKNMPLLLIAALLTIYIVLGILYESLVHPITILSTIPSAGVGALLAMLLCNISFTLIAGIGIILLIGIVKKNAIMMVDFALEIERSENTTSQDAIYRACLLRFRPIMMTSFAAILGALPLAIGLGEGGEFRQPLGITIVGGLILSQILTLYTTPVVYIYLDKLRNK